MFAGVAVFWIAFWFLAYKQGAYQRLEHALGSSHARGAVGLTVIVIGYIAHRFKRFSQRWYGTVEVIFGTTSAFAIVYSVRSLNASLTQAATLLGCAYVVARGLNNMHDASEKELVEPPPKKESPYDW